MSPVWEYLCPECGIVEEWDSHDAALFCDCDWGNETPMRRTWTVSFARVPGGGRD